jgi:hypothetical protein
MAKFRFPTDSGNQLLRDGKIEKILPQIMEDLKPEAAYFYSEDGFRAGHFILQMQDSAEAFLICERLWFGLGSQVELIPVMAAEDLQRGLPSLPDIISRYG